MTLYQPSISPAQRQVAVNDQTTGQPPFKDYPTYFHVQIELANLRRELKWVEFVEVFPP